MILISLPYGMSARNIFGSSFLKYSHNKKILIISSFNISKKTGKNLFGNNLKKTFRYSFLSKVLRFIYKIHSSHFTSLFMNKSKDLYELQTLKLIKEKLLFGKSNYILDDYKIAFNLIISKLSGNLIFRLFENIYKVGYLIFSIKYILILKIYKPKKVFFSHVHASQDKSLLFLCKLFNIETIGLVHSWDNPTSKLLIPFKFDKVLCWNSILKREMINLYNYKSSDIEIIGIPQFDVYKNYPKINKEEFLKKIFNNSNKKLISFYCPSPAFVNFQKKIIDDIIEIIESLKNINLIIRLHPGNNPNWLKSNEYKKDYLFFNKPDNSYLADTAEMINFDKINDDFFINSLIHSDVTINCFSTTSIDSIYFDTPNISIGYDTLKTKNIYDKIDFYYKWKHYEEIINMNCISVAKNKIELQELIFNYINNKEIKTIERKATKLKFINNLNGDSGLNLAKYIFN